MRMRNRVQFLLLCSICSTGVFAQNSNRAIDSLTTVLKTAKEDTSKVNTLTLLSWQFRNISNYEKAKQYVDSSLQLADKLNFKKGKARAYNVIGVVNSDNGNYPEALKNHFASLKIRKDIEHKEGIAASYNNIGEVYRYQGNYPEAMKNYLASLKISEEIGDRQGAANSYNNIGIIYRNYGNYPEALKNCLASLKLKKEIGTKQGIAGSYNNIGTIYSYQGNYPEALKYYLATLEISKEIGDKRTIAVSYFNIGYIYQNQSNFPDALKNYMASLKINEEIGNKKNISDCFNNIGIIYALEGNYSEALENQLAALKMSEEIGDKLGVAETYISLGDVVTKQAIAEKGKEATLIFNEAIQYLNKGLLIAKEIGQKEVIKNAYENFAETYKGMNEYRKALEYNNLYITLKDSLINNESTRMLEQQRTQFEVEKAVTEEKLQQERLLADERVANEKKLVEEKSHHELLAAENKFRFELALADEKTKQEKIKVEEQFKKEQALTAEKLKSGQALEATKVQQEKEKATIKRRNELLMMGLGMLVFVLIFVFLYLRQRNLKQRAIERVDAVHKMAELELQGLRAQLNPHFMFNSLNAIQDLILKEDNRSSHRYLSRFSKLLRMLLDNANQPFISLKKELDFLELYLSLENLRIPDLQYTIKTEPGIDTETTLVPNMTLQPFIENAIWHGLSHKTSDKKLGVNIHIENGSIQCDIEDNGVGRKKAEELKSLYRREHKSKGMELLSKRFSLLSKEYGTDIQTRVTDLMNNGHATGTLVEITVPQALTKKAILYDTHLNN